VAGTIWFTRKDHKLRSSSRRQIVSDALIDLCRGQPVDLPPDEGVHADFVEAVRHHRLAPLAEIQLRDTAPAIAKTLVTDRDAAKASYIKSIMLLAGLDEILGDIPWLAFKGPVLSEYAHPVPGLRSFNDVDVLVSPARLRDTAEQLLAAGWQIADNGQVLRMTETPGEMHWISAAGIVVDLHWSMINSAKTRRAFPTVTDQLLADRVRVTVGLSSTWTLSPADTLVHVCVHAAKTGANHMQMLLDADQLVRQTEDWDSVIRQVQRWGAAQAVAIVLHRARSILGTPTPPDLDQRLGVSGGFHLVTRVTNRLSPVPSLRQDPSLARLVARSAHPGNAKTLAAMARRAVNGVAYRLGPGTTPLTWARTDSDTLETYLRAVEAEAAQSG
jgi:hypothetical protein